MISKQPTIDDIYNFDAYISTPGVREGLMQRATLDDPEFTLEDTDDGQAMYFNTPHGEQVFVGMPEQTMPGRQEGDVMLAAGPSGTVSDAGATIGPTPRNPVMGGVADFVRGVRDLANEYEIKQFVPLLGGMGVGDLLMGKSPEELEEWAYGNAPMRVPEMTSVPMIKTGRKEQLADTMFLGMDAAGLGKGAGIAARTTAKKLGPKAGQMISKSMEKLGTPLQMNIVEPGPKILEQAIDLQPGLNVGAGNKIGVEQDLRVKIAAPDLEMPDKPLLTLTTDEKNVNRQIDNLDLIFSKFQDPKLTQDSWTRMLGYAFKSDEVPVPPYAAIKALESPENLAAPLRKLTQGQIDDASAGFKNAAQFKDLYTSGKADVVTTGKLFLWSFLSRGVSPYVQEGLFMDAISGIEPFLKKAASGKFDKEDLDEYLKWASTVAGKGSGQPGSGAIHNLNAFGKNFLTKLAQKNSEGVTGLQKVHEMMASPTMTGPQIRREFAKIGTGVGIDNKVVSFTLLVSGRDDVLVIDRVQLRNLWDDGRFTGKNLWDGRTEKRMVKKKDGKEIEESAKIAGTALSEITYGAKGLLVYEALERAMAQQLKDAYKLVGRETDASLGRYHWETWVAGSQQEASHGTIDAIMREAAGVKEPFKGVTAKQGEYGMYDYGVKYGVDDSGPYFLYDTSKGDQYRFTVPEYRDMLGAIKDPNSGIVPKNFKISASGNAPWFERPEVNRSKLDDLITSRGSAVGNAPAGKQLVSADGKSSTTPVTRSRAARARGSVLNGGPKASNKGAK
jgi:hypothetical protein